jgi:hypothetical protein
MPKKCTDNIRIAMHIIVLSYSTKYSVDVEIAGVLKGPNRPHWVARRPADYAIL